MPTSTLATRLGPASLVRAIALGGAGVMMGIVLAGILLQYSAVQRPCAESAVFCAGLRPGNLRGLASPERALTFYATFRTVQDLLARSVFWTVALVLIWRRPTQPVALLAAFLFLATGSTGGLFILATRFPLLEYVRWFMLLLFYGGLALLFCLFPNGRFVPRWSRWPAFAWCAVLVIDRFLPTSVLDRLPPWFTDPVLLFFLSLQIYRYWRVATPGERRQARWAILGFALMLSGFAAISLSGWTFPVDRPLTAVDYLVGASHSLFACAIPVTIGIAILRHNLFDIDLVINRALVYGGLTAGIVASYMLIVGTLGTLLQARGSFLVSLIGAGVVALLFQPLREWLQRGVNRLMYGSRDEPYAVVARLGRRLADTLAPEAVLPTIVQQVQEMLKLPYAALALRQPDGSFDVRTAVGKPVEHMVAFPLLYRGEQIGQLIVGARPGESEVSAADRMLLEDLARHAGVAAHAVRLTDDLQYSREQLVVAREEERRRLRRDLHDGLGPSLATMTLQADTARSLLRADPDEADTLLRELTGQAQTTMQEVRRLIHALRPPVLDDLGLIAALRALAASFSHGGPAITVEAPAALPPLPAAVEVAAYRIAQEALANVARHAHARQCVVSLDCDAALHLYIRDDGRGVPAGRTGGVGLASMRERAEELGGMFRVEPGEGGGTVVSVELPLRGSNGADPGADR